MEINSNSLLVRINKPWLQLHLFGLHVEAELLTDVSHLDPLRSFHKSFPTPSNFSLVFKSLMTAGGNNCFHILTSLFFSLYLCFLPHTLVKFYLLPVLEWRKNTQKKRSKNGLSERNVSTQLAKMFKKKKKTFSLWE